MELFYTLLALFFVAGSLAEFWLHRKENPDYFSFSDFKTSLLLMLSGLAVDLVVKIGAIHLLQRLSAHALFPIAYEWWSWVLCYIVWDLVFYMKHYHEHNVRFMWAIHVNHHSSEHMNLSTSLRSGVFKSLYRYFYWAIPVLIGFPLPMFLVLYGLAKVWAFFSHSQKLGKWGALEKWTVTPSHHLLHHSCNEQNLNKNFGETLIIWDRLFGTFKESTQPLVYGIGEHIDLDRFRTVVFHEFDAMIADVRQAKGWRKKLGVVFGRPPVRQKQDEGDLAVRLGRLLEKRA